MFKRFRGYRSTSKAEVIMSFAGALVALWGAIDTYKDYVADRELER